MKKVFLLVNIGTPASAASEDVGVYLKQFLMDPDVINLPFPIRWFLVNILIVPRRKYKSAEAYEKVWTERGSPLLFLTEDLSEKMNTLVAEGVSVDLAMRYGTPSIESKIKQYKDYDEIVIVPMFPQYSDATTKSVAAYSLSEAKKLGVESKIKFKPEFFADEFYIKSLSFMIEEARKEKDFDHLLFSYHGLPQSMVKNSDASGFAGKYCLLSDSCCDTLNEKNSKCYRAQCFATTRAVVDELGIAKEKHSVSFQSRLGRAEWVRPYSDDIVKELAQSGVKKLAVVCPAFLIDCLETLEEIAIGLNEEFQEHGGDVLTLIPCLNAEDHWSESFSQWLQKS